MASLSPWCRAAPTGAVACGSAPSTWPGSAICACGAVNGHGTGDLAPVDRGDVGALPGQAELRAVLVAQRRPDGVARRAGDRALRALTSAGFGQLLPVKMP